MLIDITPLRISRDYRLLYFGQLVSFFGSMMSFVILPWQMMKLTNSNEMVGFIYLVEFGPMFLLAFVGGALADAFDRRLLLRVTEIGQLVVTLILLMNAVSPSPQIWILYVAAALHAGLAAIQRPAFESLIQKIMPAEMMSAVVALNTLRFNFGVIIAPSLAGLITSQFSLRTVYLIDLVTFAASLVAVFMISASPVAESAARASLKSIIEGLRYAWRRPELIGTYLIDFFAMFFAFPQALYPALALFYGEKYLGAFPAALAVGMLVGNLTSGWTSKIRRHGLMVALAAVFWGVGIVFFGLAESVWVALFFLAVAGYFDMISGLFRMTMWNQTIPNYLRGRLASLEMISYLAGPMLGGAKMGIVADRYGVKTAIISGGILCVVGVAVSSLMLPKFLKYDSKDGIRQREIEEKARETNESGAVA